MVAFEIARDDKWVAQGYIVDVGAALRTIDVGGCVVRLALSQVLMVLMAGVGRCDMERLLVRYTCISLTYC